MRRAGQGALDENQSIKVILFQSGLNVSEQAME
jgi:hypothetical protein